MICLLAMVVFGILGIFSVTHRKIAIEAFDCVFRRITLRKCDTGLDKRLKSQITGKLMRRWPKAGKWTFKHFELISWFFTILLVVSVAYSGYSLYNVYVYGNCYGPEPAGFCIFDPFRDLDSQDDHESCTLEGAQSGEISLLEIYDDDPSIGPQDAKVTIIEAGCFTCEYTQKAQDTVKKILDEYEGQIRFVYKDFPISSSHENADIAAMAAHCANDQDRFFEYGDVLFDNQDKQTKDDLKSYAKELGLDTIAFDECLDNETYKEKIDKEKQEGIDAGIYGTPTFFINEQVVVGPKTFKEFKKLIDEELER